MKQTFAIIAAVIIAAAQITSAQETAKKFPTEESRTAFATKNILVSFRTGNEGVVESALRLTAEMKMRYPATDMTDLVKAMTVIKKEHKNGTIRYKAFVAISVCENPEWYGRLMNNDSENNEHFFRSASNVLNEQLLTSAE